MYAVSDEARTDLDEIWLHIARDDPRAADGVIDFLEGRFRDLALAPGMGRVRSDLWPNTLCFNTGKGSWRSHFLIFYTMREQGLEIARVLEGHRDIAPSMFR